ncbi:MAG: aryl-sulfate sulfotransferase [Acetivibrio sp.]
MKKILKTIAVVSVIMLVLLGTGAFFLYRSYNEKEKAEKKVMQEERDMQVYGIKKEKITEDEIFPLYLSGDEKNVKTFSFSKTEDIYNVKKSKEVKEKLDDFKKKNKYPLENCLWVYNPFGTHELSLYLYFEPRQVVSLRYTIHIEDEDIPDYTRTAEVNKKLAEDKKLECTITGLVPGVKNYIIVKLYDTKGNQVKRMVYSITPPELEGKVPSKLIRKDGSSLAEMSNGLYLFLGYDTENKKIKKKIYLYDNSGIIRGTIPLVKDQANRVSYIHDHLFYNYSDTGFAEVSSLGQVMKTYEVKGYTLAKDYVYDGFGSILSIASKKGCKTIEDQVISLNLNTGKTKRLIDMGTLLKKVKENEKNKEDWIGLNSIIWAGSDSIIISAGEISGIFKINNISSVKPSLQYVIGDKPLLKKKGIKKKFYAKYEADTNQNALKEEPFLSQYGQSNVQYSTTQNNAPTQYYLTMFNNNYNKSKEKTSYYYKYYIDEDGKTYDLAESFKVPFSTIESSVQEYKENLIVNSGTNASLGEYDTKGVLIQELIYPVETFTYRIWKEEFKNFWFS